MKHPSFSLRLSKLLLDHITPLIQQVDIAMGWKWLRSGQILIRKGDPTKCLSIILSGRLRAIKSRSEHRFDQEEWGRGMSVGEREVVLNLPSPHTVRAVRDSEIAVITSDVLLAIGQQRPSSIYGFLKYQARASKRGDTARTRYRSVALVMLSGGGNNRAMTHQDKNAFDLLCERLCTFRVRA